MSENNPAPYSLRQVISRLTIGNGPEEAFRVAADLSRLPWVTQPVVINDTKKNIFRWENGRKYLNLVFLQAVDHTVITYDMFTDLTEHCAVTDGDYSFFYLNLKQVLGPDPLNIKVSGQSATRRYCSEAAFTFNIAAKNNHETRAAVLAALIAAGVDVINAFINNKDASISSPLTETTTRLVVNVIHSNDVPMKVITDTIVEVYKRKGFTNVTSAF